MVLAVPTENNKIDLFPNTSLHGHTHAHLFSFPQDPGIVFVFPHTRSGDGNRLETRSHGRPIECERLESDTIAVSLVFAQ